MYDLAVIGGGPVGATLARLSAEKGHRVVLLEEHGEPGRPVQCAGLVSSRIRGLTAFVEDCVLNEVVGANILGPKGENIQVKSPSDKVLVIDRHMFDRELWDGAVSQGADGCLATQARVVSEQDTFCKIETSAGPLEARYVAGCDGPASIVRRSMKLGPPPLILSGIGAEARAAERIEDAFVSLQCGREIAPGFFAWSIPLGGQQVRIGLAVEPNLALFSAREYIERLMKKPVILGLTSSLKVESWSAGVIPLSPPSMVSSARMLLAGDAACHVKATSGGGLVMGLKGAFHAADAITKALSEERGLGAYDRLWQRDMGRELKRDWALHKYYASMDDEKLSKAFAKFSDNKAIDIINRMGDIDYPSKLVFPLLLAKPSLAAMILPLAWKYIFS